MIELNNVSYIYGEGSPYESIALRDINLKIEDGEIVGIIGHTGSGKSTLVNIMGGIVKPTDGRVLIDGEDITEMKSVVKKLGGKIGVVFQYPEYQLFEETVYKDIAFGPKNLGLSDEEIDIRVREAAKMTNISEELFDKSPFELSGGQKRRVAIAGILSMKPKMLILDEPAAGLDPGGRERVLGEIKEMHKKYGITVILVSHSMEDVAEVCERIVVMSKGRMLKCSPMKEVFENSSELKENGLSIPEITEIMLSLKNAGLPVRDDIFRMEDALSELIGLFGEVH